MKKYKLSEIKEILDRADSSLGLKEWYYLEVIAKLLFNQALDLEINEMESKQ